MKIQISKNLLFELFETVPMSEVCEYCNGDITTLTKDDAENLIFFHNLNEIMDECDFEDKCEF